MKKKKQREDFTIVVGCEASGIIGSRFEKLGYKVYTVDIQACYNKEFRHLHLTSDIFTVLNTFKSIGQNIDCLIGFPPCTFLSSVGNRWINDKENYPNRQLDRELGLRFFFDLWNCDASHNIKHIMLENPKGYLSNFFALGKDYQVVHPYYFSEYASKATCLFTKNLPFLTPTDKLQERQDRAFSNYFSKLRSKKKRSETFKGLASALVIQYDKYFQDLYKFDCVDHIISNDPIFKELTVKE
jgi:site-specific DNA-cytosine methylase